MALSLFWASILLGAFLAILAADIMGLFSFKNKFPVDGRTIVVTGGSQGLGRGLARLLASKGANVVIVARNQKKLDEALAYIKTFAKDPKQQRFHAISADMTQPKENIRLIEQVTAWNHDQPPDIVWANAGMAHPGLFIDTDLETLRAQMEINYWAAVYLAQASLRTWLKPTSSQTHTEQPARHFVMTSSSAALVGVAGYAPYAPTKAALRSLADTLRSEVNLYNGHRSTNKSCGVSADVHIHCVMPGTITSPGLVEENKTKHPVTRILEDGDPEQTEDEVAAVAVRALERGDFLITTQFLGHAMRAGALGGTPRNGLGIVDTLFAWAVNVAWLFINPDMESKVYKFGKKNPVTLPS